MNALAESPAIEHEPLQGSALLQLADIKPNPWNREISDESLQSLANDIRKRGVMQPIVVRVLHDAKPGTPRHEIVAGERRWRGSKLAGLTTIPAMVKDVPDLEVIELMLVENLERAGLHPLDEAEGYSRLLRRADGLQGFPSITALAEHFDKSLSYVTQRLKLLSLCDAAKQAFRKGELEFSHVRAISMIPDEKQQAQATEDILRGWGGERFSARQAMQHVQQRFMLRLYTAPWKMQDADLLPSAGACDKCPKRTGANPDLFEGVTADDTCTDTACFQAKRDAHQARLRAEAEASGKKVVTEQEAKKQKLVRLDIVNHNLAPGQTKQLGQLLGKKPEGVVMMPVNGGHELAPAMPEHLAKKLLQDKGVIKPKASGKNNDAKAAEQAKAEIELAVRKSVALDLLHHQALAEPGFRMELLRHVAVAMWITADYDSARRVQGMLDWPDSDSEGKRRDRIYELADDDLARYFVAMVLQEDLDPYAAQAAHPLLHLGHLAATAGIDMKAVRKQIGRERAQGGKAQVTPEKALAKAIKAGVKYWDPATGSTWTGRGLQPQWLKTAIANGKTLADFAV